ncbi:MAG: hypothetical protein WBP55_01995 [Solirubrobacterales bacterium]
MEYLIGVILGAAVGAFVTYPFWGGREASIAVDPERAALEAARDSKYREIRDAETDLASGKLSQGDFDEINADLRSDAVKILEKLDRVGGKVETEPSPPDDRASKPGDS